MKQTSPAARSRRSRPSLPAGRFARLFAGALITGIAVTAAVPAVASQASGRSITSGPLPRAFFGLGPASKTKIDGRPFFNWSSSPGGHFIDHVAIVNFGATAVTLRVFVTNAVSTASGETGFLPRGKSVGGPTDWVKISFPHNSSLITLAPRTKVILKITVAFPKNAPPGDHVGAVIAALSSVIRSKHHAKVHFVQQVADRIIARVGGQLHPGLSIANMRVVYHDPINPFTTAPAKVTFTVKNPGNEVLGGKVSVSVQGTLGTSEAAAHPIAVPALLPGGSDQVSVTVNGVYPEFWMTAKATINPLVVLGQNDKGITTYFGQAGFFAMPWIPFGIFILVVLGAVGTWLRRRRRRAVAVASPTRPGGEEPARPRSRELVEETLVEDRP